MSVGSQRNECKAADIAAEALIAANILVVAAAGNSAVDACSVHPASALNTLTVGAVGIDDTTATDTLWSQSNHGKVQFLALWVQLLHSNRRSKLT